MAECLGEVAGSQARTVPAGLITSRAAGARYADLAETVASLIPPLRRGLVLDPACGRGLLLAAAAHRFGSALRYAGQDASPSNVSVAASALAAAGAPDAEIVLGSAAERDALSQYRGSADAVVCLPPPTRYTQTEQLSLELPWEVGPPSSGSVDPYLMWMQACYSYLKPDGEAIVAAPHASSVRHSGRRVRAELLRAGALRQVIALPERFPTPASGAWHLWMLHRPAGKPAYVVRLVDLTAVQPEDVPTNLNQWQEIYRDESFTRDVPAIELLDQDLALAPAWHVEPPPRDLRREYSRQRAELTKAVGRLDVALPAFRRSSELPALAMTTIADLIRAGALTFLEKDDQPQRDDVIVRSGPGWYEALVVSQARLGQPKGTDRWTKNERSPVDVLRCTPSLLDPFFLACFLRSEINRRLLMETTGSVSRSSLRRARILRAPLTEQLPYADAFDASPKWPIRSRPSQQRRAPRSKPPSTA